MNTKKNPRMAQFNVRLTLDELENLRRKAWDSNKSVSDLVRDIAEFKKLISPDGRK